MTRRRRGVSSLPSLSGLFTDGLLNHARVAFGGNPVMGTPHGHQFSFSVSFQLVRLWAKLPQGEKEEGLTAPDHIIPLSSSSACSISVSLTMTSRRGTTKIIVQAQSREIASTAAVSGSVVAEWPPR